MASLCHPWFTTTKLSYRFPIFETSATALCGTTGISEMRAWLWRVKRWSNHPACRVQSCSQGLSPVQLENKCFFNFAPGRCFIYPPDQFNQEHAESMYCKPKFQQWVLNVDPPLGHIGKGGVMWCKMSKEMMVFCRCPGCQDTPGVQGWGFPCGLIWILQQGVFHRHFP